MQQAWNQTQGGKRYTSIPRALGKTGFEKCQRIHRCNHYLYQKTIEKIWFLVCLSKRSIIRQHFWWIDLANFENAGNVLFPHKGTRKNHFPHVPKFARNTKILNLFQSSHGTIIGSYEQTLKLEYRCMKQAGYRGFLWNIQWSSVKGNTRTHLFQTEVLWPCSKPIWRWSGRKILQPDPTRPNTRIFLIPVQNGNKPKERINP